MNNVLECRRHTELLCVGEQPDFDVELKSLADQQDFVY